MGCRVERLQRLCTDNVSSSVAEIHLKRHLWVDSMTTQFQPAEVKGFAVAVQRQEVLRTGGEGDLVKEAKEVIHPTLYTAKDGRVEVQQLAPFSTLSLLA